MLLQFDRPKAGAAAVAPADEVHWTDREARYQPGRVFGHAAVGERPFSESGAAVTARVDHYDAVIARQRRYLPHPGLNAHEATMQ
jgi:hypothetical protein